MCALRRVEQRRRWKSTRSRSHTAPALDRLGSEKRPASPAAAAARRGEPKAQLPRTRSTEGMCPAAGGWGPPARRTVSEEPRETNGNKAESSQLSVQKRDGRQGETVRTLAQDCSTQELGASHSKAVWRKVCRGRRSPLAKSTAGFAALDRGSRAPLPQSKPKIVRLRQLSLT